MDRTFVRPSFPSRLGTAVAAFTLSLGTIALTAPAAFAVTAPCSAPSSKYALTGSDKITVPDNGTVVIEYLPADGSLNVDINGSCTNYTDVLEMLVYQSNGNDDADVTLIFSDTADLPDTTIDLNNGNDSITLKGTAGNDNLDATEFNLETTGGGLEYLIFAGLGGNDLMVESSDVSNKDHIVFGGGAGTDTADRSDRNADLTYVMPGDLENYIGGQQDDTVTGNPLANRIEGGDDNDELRGLGGNDVILGNDGNDALYGGDGNDILVGGSGTNTYDGGSGTDTVTFDTDVYEDAADGDVVFDAKAVGNKSIENIIGSPFDDTLTGNDGPNRITGGEGDDELFGGRGTDSIDGGLDDDIVEGGDNEDVLDGGLGFDLVSYSGSDAGVTVNLASAYPSGGDASGDLIGGFEGAVGSDFNDTLTGTAAANTLDGGKGNDLLVGLGGADKLIGGVGAHDRVTYAASTEGVTVSLLAGAGKGGDAEGDVLSKVEDIIGTSEADILVGNRYGNVITAGAGNDKVSGGVGADTIDGGEGTDTMSYAEADEGLTIRLGFGDARGVGDGDDRVTSIENVIGSKFADTIIGNDDANIINGGGGADTIMGMGGNDTVFGGTGSDRLNGGDGNDKLAGGGGDDTLIGGTGQDVCAPGPGKVSVSECE